MNQLNDRAVRKSLALLPLDLLFNDLDNLVAEAGFSLQDKQQRTLVMKQMPAEKIPDMLIRQVCIKREESSSEPIQVLTLVRWINEVRGYCRRPIDLAVLTHLDDGLGFNPCRKCLGARLEGCITPFKKSNPGQTTVKRGV